jgi:hypothetical protein
MVQGAMVTHRSLAEHGVVNAFRQLEVAVSYAARLHTAYVDMAHKGVVTEEGGIKRVAYADKCPVFSDVTLLLQQLNLVAGQRAESVCFHDDKIYIIDMNESTKYGKKNDIAGKNVKRY